MLQKYQTDQIYHNNITTVPFGSFDFVIYYAEQMDESIPVFQHKSAFYSLYYGVNGRIDVEIGDNTLSVVENSTVIIGRDQLHSVNYTPERAASYFVLLFDIVPKNETSASADSLLECREIQAALEPADKDQFIHLLHTASQDDLLLKIHREIEEHRIGWASQAGLLYYQFLLNILRQTTFLNRSAVSVPPGYQNIALEATKYIHANYTSNLATDIVAQHLNVTPRHLNRLFQKMFGCSFSHTVNVIRMNYAKKYLTSTTCSLEEIAIRVGLPSAKALSNLFQEQEGMTPHSFRKMKQRKTEAQVS